MAQCNVPWTLRRFIPWYKHDYKQTSFDRQVSNTRTDVIYRMLSEHRIEYDHTHLKGDGVPNFIPGKNFYMNELADGQIQDSAHSAPSRTVHNPARAKGDGIGSGSHRSRGSRSGYAGSERPHVSFGPNNCVEDEPDRPNWPQKVGWAPSSRVEVKGPDNRYRPKPGWRPRNRFRNQSPNGLTSTSTSFWGGRGFGIFNSGRPSSSRGDRPDRGSKPVRSHPPALVPPPAIPGRYPPPRSHHSGSRSPGLRSPPPIPGDWDPSHSVHDSRPPTRSSHHTPPRSPAASRGRHGRPATGSSHHTAPGSPAPSRSHHSRLSTAPESRLHTASSSYHSQPPAICTDPRPSSQSQPYCPPLAGSSLQSAPGSSSHHAACSSHRSAPSSPPLVGSGLRSQHSRAGSGCSLPSRGRSGGGIEVSSRGTTWKDV